MKRLLNILLLLCFFVPITQWAQESTGNKRSSIYEKYDDSFITPNLRRKHVVSFGPIASTYGPYIEGNEPPYFKKAGIHLGYNYTIFEKRKIKLAFKSKFRDEIKVSFGIHLNMVKKGEFSILGNFYRPLIASKGRLFSWCFLSSYGIGIHKTTDELNAEKPFRLDATIEFFRFRIGRLPLYINLGGAYDLGNKITTNDRKNIGATLGLRYDFYKR